MSNFRYFAVLLFLVFLVACQPKTIAICPDGSVVDDPMKCPPQVISGKVEPPDIERIAKLFGIYWQNKEYDNLWKYLHPEIKKLKTQDEFFAIFELSGIIESDIAVVFQNFVFESEDSAYANYIITNKLGTIKPVALKMEFIDDNWRVFAFQDLLIRDTLSAACWNSASADLCAFEVAKRLRKDSYCEYTGCSYEACLIHFNRLITDRERRHYCDLCEIENCIHNQALKYTDFSLCAGLDESTQFNAFDKYYYCYGDVALKSKSLSVCEKLKQDAFNYACTERYNNPMDNLARKNDIFRMFTRLYFARPA